MKFKIYFSVRTSKGRVKTANRAFSQVNNDQELTFDSNTEVLEVADNEISMINIKRTQVKDIENLPANAICDVLGIAQEISPLSEFTSKAGRALTKLEVSLIDESNASIRITVWNEKAKELDAQVRGLQSPIIAVKGAKVSEWGGRTLGTGHGSQVLVNPDLQETQSLRQWFDNGGAANVTSLSGGAGGGSRKQTSFKDRHTLASITELGLGKGEGKGDYVDVEASIAYINKEKMWYEACPVEGNNKKVVQQSDGTWLCEGTGETFQTKQNRYILRAQLTDYTGMQYVTFFDDQAKDLIGKSADDLELLKEEGNEAGFQQALNEACFNHSFSHCAARRRPTKSKRVSKQWFSAWLRSTTQRSVRRCLKCWKLCRIRFFFQNLIDWPLPVLLLHLPRLSSSSSSSTFLFYSPFTFFKNETTQWLCVRKEEGLEKQGTSRH